MLDFENPYQFSGNILILVGRARSMILTAILRRCVSGNFQSKQPSVYRKCGEATTPEISTHELCPSSMPFKANDSRNT